MKTGAQDTILPRNALRASADVLRFMGKQIGCSGSVPDWVAGEVATSLKSRVVGDRLKHRIQGNSLKCYGKAHTEAGDVFRVETVPHRYQVSPAGRLAISAVLTTSEASLSLLNRTAA